ncbi:MAG: T9SS type A sorting domain-containing protein [Bacteroidetes bacterium]|nr:T9SS type A sorting domain-containing protein [Bacteroidota bacterium]
MKKPVLVLLLSFIFLCSTSAQNWSIQNSGVLTGLNSVFFTDTCTGYAVGDFGVILKTTDGGLNWTSQNSGNLNNIQSVYFINQDIGFAVGAAGKVLKTINGGSNWTLQTSGTGSWLFSVLFPDSITGYAVGIDGTMIKTSDAGESWSVQNTGTINWLYSISFPNTDTGFIVGGDNEGRILNTYNGGSSWNSQISWGPLFAVNFTDTKTGYAVGDDGSAIKTEDGGDLWTNMNTGVAGWFRSICFLPENGSKIGYIVGGYDSCIMLKTLNGGDNWSVQEPVTPYALTSIFFIPNGHGLFYGYAAGDHGVILKTSIVGLNVGVEPLLSKSKLFKVYPNPATNKINVDLTRFNGEKHLSVINPDGKTLLERSIKDNSAMIDISALSRGVYFIRVNNEKNVEINKFVVE